MMPCSCGKNARQRLYCHHPDCGRITAMDLPRPTVDVVTNDTDSGHAISVTVSRDGKGRSYTGGGTCSTTGAAVKEVVEKILNDPYTAEFLPNMRGK